MTGVAELRARVWGLAGLAGAVLACGLAGCGTPGAPLPPSLNLPEPVTDLSAVRTGDQVMLKWTMPRRNTDKLLLKNHVTVRVCRMDGASGCVDAGAGLTLAPGVDGSFRDELPAVETAGEPRVLRYFVELKNRNGRSAGLSNAATVAAGRAPAAVEGLAAEVRKAGVVLRWKQNGEKTSVRLKRTLLTPPKTKPKEDLLSPGPEPLEQTLRVDDGDDGQALDKSVRFGQTYAYRAQRVAQVTVDGRTLELAGALSDTVRVEVKDVFPPGVPAGLAAVATVGDDGAVAIDLNWQPVTDEDLAGYVVYRREGNGAWQKISPKAPVVGPAFHDVQVQAGHTYDYAVTALDERGHESARSDVASETVPEPD